jgi:beta-glucosidase
VLLPWKNSVAAVLLNFLAGEQAGHGLADVLWGDVSPSARLPVTLPNRDNEVEFTEAQYPGVGDGPTATYSEGLLVGYRWYDAHAVAPEFPFGHGLSYTSFAYGALTVTPAEDGSGGWFAAVQVTNAGSVSGAEVAQLYLAFPEGADEPPQQLKGVAKVGPLAPGAAATVTFGLPERAFSTWDSQQHAWAAANGTFTLSVGASSRDFRGTTTLDVAWPQSAAL